MTAAAGRECQRYYQPWLAAHGSAVAVAQHVSSLAELDLQKQGWEPLPSRDRILIALAQNVVLRLGARRCMISLIDENHQYVLGEATKSHSSIHPNGGPGDEIWLGSAILARPDAVCENCLDSQCTPNDRQHVLAEGMIVDDCRQDSRFAHRPYVVQEEGIRVRFYAGVPLISRNGYKVGVLAVTDENPRAGLSADDLVFMQDMARCAMTHLEWARDRVDRFKGERVVRGMATFIEEATSLRAQPSAKPGGRRPALRRSNSWRRIPRRASRGDSDDVYSLACDILRDSTLADGCVVFGATAGPGPHEVDAAPLDRSCKILALSITDQDIKTPLRTGEEGPLTLGTLYKYFEAASHGRTFAFTEDSQVMSSDEEDCEASDGQEQRKTSSGSDRSLHSTNKAPPPRQTIDHHELLQKLPGARAVTFLPLRNPTDGRLIAGAFLWASALGRMPDTDLSHVRAYADCVVGEIMRIDAQRNEAAKTTFIASISHELRSPLHGILGAAEFLIETTDNAYVLGLITSIITCGKTLLDTLNHVLDHSKINKIGRIQKNARSKERRLSLSDISLSTSDDIAAVDLGALVEEVADAVTAGHTFKNISSYSSSSASKPLFSPNIEYSFDSLTARQDTERPRSSQGVTVLLDITPRHSWMVKVQQGSVQRIIMNLFGNALKYTSAGFVALSLRTLESAEQGKVSVLIRVVDSGKGIGDAFQRENLFVPFSQEDSFQPGTGLGLSIVKQIVDSLGGSIELRSTPNLGTEVDVYLTLETESAESPNLGMPESIDPCKQIQTQNYPLAMASKLVGKRLVLLDPLDPAKTRTPVHQASRFQQILRETCEKWFGMHVSRSTSTDNDEDVAMYLYGEPPPIEMLRHHKRTQRQRSTPVILACQNSHDSISVIRNQQTFLQELGEIVEVIQQPCGPRKLAKTFMHCLSRAEEINAANPILVTPARESLEEFAATQMGTSSQLPQRPSGADLSSRTTGQELRKSVSTALAPPTPPTLDPETPSLQSEELGDTSLDLLSADDAPAPSEPQEKMAEVTPQQMPTSNTYHILLVDDNKINRSLLVMFMKKNKFTYLEAENGQEAVDLFSASLKPGAHAFDYVLMDISMPVMDGMEATRQIRALEKQHRSETKSRTKVFALTGLASEKAREEAETAGVDLFLPKPVRFAELRSLLS